MSDTPVLGHSKFDEVWLDLANQLLTKGTDAYGVSFTLPSLLDVAPTLPMPAKSIANAALMSLNTLSSGRSLLATDHTTFLPCYESSLGLTFLLYPEKDGKIDARVVIADVKLHGPLQQIALWISQIFVARLHAAQRRPGAVTFEIGRLVVENEEEKAGLLAVVMDNPPNKLGSLVRRGTNQRRIHDDASFGKDLWGELEVLGPIHLLLTSGYEVSHQGGFLLANSLSQNTLSMLEIEKGPFQAIPPFEDPALSSLFARAIRTRPAPRLLRPSRG